MSENKDSDDVDEQAHDADAQELFVMNVDRFNQSLRFGNKKNTIFLSCILSNLYINAI